jgi:catechol 2,3-dioxygenase-like lactoylglutathione lyase family enzyme
MIERISAVTLVTRDMGPAVRFYRALGFSIRYGGEATSFTSFTVGSGYLNLVSGPAGAPQGWGRVVFYVSDVDALHARALAAGLAPTSEPRDAEWGERFFHILDPDGHELSFAKPFGALG